MDSHTSLPSHPFADLFALVSPDSIPKWTSVIDLLRRLSDKEQQLGGEDVDAVTEWLEKLENARDLLRETEEQLRAQLLVELYFDGHVHDLADEASSADVAIGEVRTPGDRYDQEPPELALDLGEVARQQQGSAVVEYEGNAEVEICRRLMGVLGLAAEGTSNQGSEVHDLDIEKCREIADIQAASHQAEGASIQLQAGGVHYEGNAEVEICRRLKSVMDLDEAASEGPGQASEGRDVDIEELQMDFVEVGREDSASHQFEGGEDDDPDEEEGIYKDVEMS